MMAADAIRTVIDMADLDDLAPLSKRLNAATDELNQVLESIQNKLNSLAIGVEVWLDRLEADHLAKRVLSEENGVRTVEVHELGYGRFGDGWALLVRTSHYEQTREALGWDYTGKDPIYEDLKPLLRAARNLRVIAVDRIPKLVDELQAEAGKVMDAVEKAKKIAESLK